MSVITLPAVPGARGTVTLEQEAAHSWARMEAERGRPLDVNRSTVDRASQMRLYLDYTTGRSKVLALHPDKSWHCEPIARAVDTDDDQWIRAHPDHGWQFVVASEKWHAQYYPHLDKHRGTGNPAGTETTDMTPDQAAQLLHINNAVNDANQRIIDLTALVSRDLGHVVQASNDANQRLIDLLGRHGGVDVGALAEHLRDSPGATVADERAQRLTS